MPTKYKGDLSMIDMTSITMAIIPSKMLTIADETNNVKGKSLSSINTVHDLMSTLESLFSALDLNKNIFLTLKI